MKTTNLVNLMILSGFAAALSACGPQQQSRAESLSVGAVPAAIAAPEDVTLLSRYNGGTYERAVYSFRFLTQDVELTRNNWEILFEATGNVEDYFQVNTVVDDNSLIYDLGSRSCNDIKSRYPADRKNRPLVWLAYSDAGPAQMEPKRSVKVQEGHCYLTYNNDEDGRVVALFHVKSHVESKSVTIDQIEVLNVLSRQ